MYFCFDGPLCQCPRARACVSLFLRLCFCLRFHCPIASLVVGCRSVRALSLQVLRQYSETVRCTAGARGGGGGHNRRAQQPAIYNECLVRYARARYANAFLCRPPIGNMHIPIRRYASDHNIGTAEVVPGGK